MTLPDAYFDAAGADWSNIAEYLIRKYNGSLPHQEQWPHGGPRRRKQRQAAKERG